jgi:hypothetical protein
MKLVIDIPEEVYEKVKKEPGFWNWTVVKAVRDGVKCDLPIIPIYGSCEPEDTDFFKDIEDALGYKLFFWQKTYIMSGVFRRYGETTAMILRRLLKDDRELDFTRRPSSFKEKLYREEVMKIYEKLNAKGIKTCPVFTSRRDKDKNDETD